MHEEKCRRGGLIPRPAPSLFPFLSFSLSSLPFFHFSRQSFFPSIEPPVPCYIAPWYSPHGLLQLTGPFLPSCTLPDFFTYSPPFSFAESGSTADSSQSLLRNKSSITMAKKKSKSNNNSKSKAAGQAASAVRSHPNLADQEEPAAQTTAVNTTESAPVLSTTAQSQPDPEVREQGHGISVLQNDLRIHDSQSPSASVDSGLGAGHNGRVESAPKHRDEPVVETSYVNQENGSRTSLEEFRPFSERAPPRRYEDDDDDHEHYRNEQAPLIRTSSNDGHYSDRGPVPPSSHSASRRLGGEPPSTWVEWALKSGLHPRTWTRQTYIKAGLLATLLTLIILSFTVFRVQDHIKDILR